MSGPGKLDYSFLGRWRVDAESTVATMYNVPGRSLSCFFYRDLPPKLKLMTELSMNLDPADTSSSVCGWRWQ